MRNHSGRHSTPPYATQRPKILPANFIPSQPRNFKIVEVKVFNTRLGLVVRVRLGLVVVGRCCWGPRWGGITKDSPEHGRTVLVGIYLAVSGGIRWCIIVPPNGSDLLDLALGGIGTESAEINSTASRLYNRQLVTSCPPI
jgi:hypothetical protein